MQSEITKAPRLYIPDDLSVEDWVIHLSRDHAHYLIQVMRKTDGDMVRVFNGRDGEFVAKLSIVNKKTAELKWIERVKDQPHADITIALYVAPIKKDRMAFLIEKAVELGVTDIHPIMSDRTQHANKINPDKIEKQMIEAAEQCERMDIPTLHPLQKLMDCAFSAPAYCALERQDAPLFKIESQQATSIIIGPEGGWSEAEIQYLSTHDAITSVSLGNNILRAETAAIFMLSRIG